MRYLLPVACCLLLLPTATAPVGAQQPTFRTETVLVRTDVTVFDADHRFVRDLSRDDFRILEDGVPQRISQFEIVDIPLAPLTATPIRPVAAEVISNADADRGRLVALILDDLNTLRERVDRVKEAARRVVARLQPDDYVWVAVISGAPAGTRDFTRDRGAVLAAIETFDPRKTRLDWNPRAIPMGTESKDSQCIYGLSQVAKRLAPIEGHRKAIIFIGEGFEGRLPEASDQRSGDRNRDLAENAARANIKLYTLDPRGPANLLAEGVAPGACSIGFLPWADRAQVAKESLDFLAEETGGTSVVDATDFGAAADRLVTDMSTYYSIAYYPTNGRADGKFRKVNVETTRRGLQVRAYAGYWAARAPARGEAPPATAPADPAATALQHAVTGLIPVSGLELHASTAAFRSLKPGLTSLAIPLEVEWPAQAVPAEGTNASDAVRLRLLVMDMKGKLHTTEDRTATMRPHRPPQSPPGIGGDPRPQRDLTLVVIDVPPGRYVFRLAAHSTLTNATGSVFLDVEAPNFASPAASVSSLSLGMAQRSASVTAVEVSKKMLLPVPPTPERDVTADDDVVAFLRAYRGKRETDGWRFQATLRSEQGAVLFTDERRDAAEAGALGTLYQVSLPIRRLSPGVYRLVIEAHADGAKPGNDIVRETSFRVH